MMDGTIEVRSQPKREANLRSPCVSPEQRGRNPSIPCRTWAPFAPSSSMAARWWGVHGAPPRYHGRGIERPRLCENRCVSRRSAPTHGARPNRRHPVRFAHFSTGSCWIIRATQYSPSSVDWGLPYRATALVSAFDSELIQQATRLPPGCHLLAKPILPADLRRLLEGHRPDSQALPPGVGKALTGIRVLLVEGQRAQWAARDGNP